MSAPSYANLSDLYRFGLPSAALGSLDDSTKQAALDARSLYAQGKLAGRYHMPLIAWDDSLTMAVCQMTAYDLLCNRGYNPANPADENVRRRFEDADKWLTSVARLEISPDLTPTPEQSPDYDMPRIDYLPLQGWVPGRVS